MIRRFALSALMTLRAARPAATLALLAGLANVATVQTASAQISTAFTYQGQLDTADSPYSGSADVQFRLYSDSGDSRPIGPALLASNIACDGGRFTVQLDFLTAVPSRGHIEISVRTPHDPTDQAPFTMLLPRQPVTASPLAYRSQEAGRADATDLADNALKLGGQLPDFYLNAANMTGTIPSSLLGGTYTQGIGFTNPGNAFSGSGAGLVALHANNIATGTLAAARGGTGSSITSATTGQVLKWNGSAFTAQADDNTTYSAGAGLALSGTTFNIPTNAVTGLMVLDGSISNLDLASDATSLSKVSGGAMQTDGTNVTFAGNITIPTTTRHMVIPATAFQVLKNSQAPAWIETNSVYPDGNTDDLLVVAAPVMLPEGAVIRAVTMFCLDAAEIDMTVELVSCDIASSTLQTVASVQSSGNSTSIQPFTVTGLSVPIAPTTSYSVTAEWTQPFFSISMALRGIRIEYTITSPLP